MQLNHLIGNKAAWTCSRASRSDGRIGL